MTGIPTQQGQPTRRDNVYTLLLAIHTFFMLGFVVWFPFYIRVQHLPSDAWVIFSIEEIFDALLVAGSIIILLVRIFAPSKRKWPTIGLNILLIFVFPLGTALAIFGLIFVDKTGKPVRVDG